VRDDLNMLKCRVWSQQWRIPDVDHEAVMRAVEKWAIETYGTLDASEETEASLEIWIAAWDTGITSE
jgi:hypothetical protein